MAMSMTEGPGGLDPRAVEGWWDDRLAEMLNLPGSPHPDRAATAAYFIAIFDEWRDEAIAIRDIEVLSLHRDAGLGGAALARAVGVHRSRGLQLITRADKAQVEAKTTLSKIKRRIRAGGRLRIVKPDED
jgi:hypothetical protein